MKHLSRLLGLLMLISSVSTWSATCDAPDANTERAFTLINQTNEDDLETFLKVNFISKDARNKNCETLYFHSLKQRNNYASEILTTLGYGSGLNERDIKLEETPYDYIVKYGNPERLQKILDPKLFYTEFEKVLHSAIKTNKLDSIDYLAKIALNNYQLSIDDILLRIIEANRPMPIVKVALRLGADPNGTHFLKAVETQNIPLVATLLEGGANPNSRKFYDTDLTAVHRAIEFDNAELLKLLIAYKANLGLTAYSHESDFPGKTPVEFAIEKDRQVSLSILLTSGAPIVKPLYGGDHATAMAYAASVGSLASIQKILAAGGSPLDRAHHYSDEALQIVLKRGVKENRFDLFQAFVDHPDFRVKAEYFYDLKDLQATSWIAYLVKLGGNVNEVYFEGSYNDNAKRSVLAEAAMNSSYEFLKELIDNGANKKAIDRHQQYPVDYGISGNRGQKIINLLNFEGSGR